jgi:hypothetical protein
VYQSGGVEIIPNDQGNRITPSWVAFTDTGERLVGEAAKNQVCDTQSVLGSDWLAPLRTLLLSLPSECDSAWTSWDYLGLGLDWLAPLRTLLLLS